MHIVKSGDRYLGFVDAQADALRFPDPADAETIAGGLLTTVPGDDPNYARSVRLTNRAERKARAEYLALKHRGKS